MLLTALLVHGQSPITAPQLLQPAVQPGYVAICSAAMQLAQLAAGQPQVDAALATAWCNEHPRAFVVGSQVVLGFVLPLFVTEAVESVLKQQYRKRVAAAAVVQ